MNTINHYTDLYNAKKYAKDYDAVVSIGHFLHETFRIDKKYLFLGFDDLSFDDLNNNPDNELYAPNSNHIQELLSFINSLHSNDNLLVHCFAGYSRSPAAVIIAKCERDGKSVHDAREEIYDARIPDKLIPSPNEIMLHKYLMLKNI
jgi:predicted protein tyrosine phosphatase